VSWEDVLVGVARLQEHVGPGEPGLRRAFEGWLAEVILPRLGAPPDEIPKRLTLEELEPMLAERIDSWNEQLREESLQQGRQEGRQEGEARALLLLLESRFGPVDQATRDRIATADADLLLKWIKRFPTAGNLADIFSG
jgi:hypothetical protein